MPYFQNGRDVTRSHERADQRRFVGEMWALVFGVSVTVVTAYSLGNQWGGAFLVIFLIAFYASAIRPTKTGRR